MAQQLGRGFTIDLDFGAGDVNIGGSNSVTITINNEPIDVTNNDSSGYRALLGSAKVMADLTFAGFHADDAVIQSIRTAINTGSQATTDFSVNVPGTTGGSAGSWDFAGLFTSIEEAGETEGAANYNISAQSTGSLTWTDLT